MTLSAGFVGARAATSELPEFKEVYGLVRSNLLGVSQAELDRDAVEGLLRQLYPRVILATNAPAGSAVETGPLLLKSTVYDDAYGYLRIGRVDKGLAAEAAGACQQLGASNKLKGLVLDLRMAGGTDYSAAAAVAEQFVTDEQPLLDWGEGLVKAKVRTNAFAFPVAILVNKQTSGAAEALAAVLRKTEAGLVIGARTAGQAGITKDFVLENGRRLRITMAPIKVGGGQALSPLGWQPDIEVPVSTEDEAAYLDDAFKVIPKAGAPLAGTEGSVSNLLTGATNRPSRRRINEAELVRLQREGALPDEEAPSRAARGADATKPVVRDPVLARALDLLKGLALVQTLRGN